MQQHKKPTQGYNFAPVFNGTAFFAFVRIAYNSNEKNICYIQNRISCKSLTYNGSDYIINSYKMP